MKYCINCGKGFQDNARFCPYCGTPAYSEKGSARTVVYEGEIHKCPNCGEMVGSFTTKCPTCGFEFRNSQPVNSVKELSKKLEEIEKKRSERKTGWKKFFDTEDQITETDQEKVSLIQSFAIPNLKEDLFEFIVLASSNINMQRYADPHRITASERAVSDAWYSKFEQSFQKARLCFEGDPDLKKMEDIFEGKHKDIRKAKKNYRFKLAMPIILYLLVGILLPALALVGVFSREEDSRLNTLAGEINQEIESGNYVVARAKLANLVYSGPNTLGGRKLAKKWENIQTELYAVINNAAESDKNSMPTNNAMQNTLDESALQDSAMSDDEMHAEVPKDFYDGYIEADFSDYNSPAKENGLGGTRIYIIGTLQKIEIMDLNGNDGILGYIVDDNGNTWLLKLNATPIVEKTHYDVAIGRRVCCTGVYNGFSAVKQMPSVTLNELLILKNGTKLNGLQKILDTTEGG